MATLTQTANRNPVIAPISEILADIASAYAKRKAYKKTVAELSLLSARELNDLGISYGDIRRLAREAAYGA